MYIMLRSVLWRLANSIPAEVRKIREHGGNKYDVEDESRSPEVNGNSYLGKRKRGRSKKQCGGYLQEWLDKSWMYQQQPDSPYGFDDEPVHRVPGFWPNHPTVPILDRRLFPTTSEPAMCRYSVPVGYSLEPISLPVYAAYMPMPEAGSSRRRNNRPMSRSNGMQGGFSSAPPPTQNNWHNRKDSRRAAARMNPSMDGANDDFTSLPPVTSSHTPDTVRRRFSDPGIGSDTCSRVSSPEPVGMNNALVLSLVEQVNALQDSNKKLYQELRETKAELENLKQSWRSMPPEYEPGMLSDLIREIRDAARVREEVLLNRVCSMLEGSGKGKPTNHLVGMPEKFPLMAQKLENIEEHLQQLQIHREKMKPSNTQADGISENQTEQLCGLEVENLRLRRNLQEAIARSKEKETQAQQLEKLVDVLKRKISVTSVDEKAASSDQSPSESLVSTVSSSSTTHSPQVTMSGPVTDL
ncbi:hypothetical protein C0J52_08683 [Blattella germanica]|nr:hypothetical protein C0J52_08683 [Blattella germanica]